MPFRIEFCCFGHALVQAKLKAPHAKTNKMIYVPSKDPEQPEHLPSHISLYYALNGYLRAYGFFR